MLYVLAQKMRRLNACLSFAFVLRSTLPLLLITTTNMQITSFSKFVIRLSRCRWQRPFISFFVVVTCVIIVGFFLRLILLLFAFLLCACQLSELFQCFLLLFNFLYELRSVLSPTSHSIRRCILSHATVKVSHWMMLLFYLRWCYIISVFVLWFAYNFIFTSGLLDWKNLLNERTLRTSVRCHFRL